MTKEPRWHWRNCRSFIVGFGIAPLNWRLSYDRESDVSKWDCRLQIGPFGFQITADHGNCSSDNRFEAWLGLSEYETYDRAMKYEGRTHDR